MKKSFKDKLVEKQRSLNRENRLAAERFLKKKKLEAIAKANDPLIDRPAPQAGPRVKLSPTSKTDLEIITNHFYEKHKELMRSLKDVTPYELPTDAESNA